MQIISNTNSFNLWIKEQEDFIHSLNKQPIVVVIRINNDDLDKLYIDSVISLINKLNCLGIKHIEIAWSSHINWILFIKELKNQFKTNQFGAASITNIKALELITNLDFKYAMSPFWDLELQKKAQEFRKILIPGVFSPSEIHQASKFGCRIIKLFPSSTLGFNYIKQLQPSLGELPFIIAAGGIKVLDIDTWLREGFKAVILGRDLIKKNRIDPLLEKWLKLNSKIT